MGEKPPILPCTYMFITHSIFLPSPWNFMTLLTNGVLLLIISKVNKKQSCTIYGYTSWVWAHPYFREGTLCDVHHGCEHIQIMREEILHATHHGCGVTHTFSYMPYIMCGHTQPISKLLWKCMGVGTPMMYDEGSLTMGIQTSMKCSV